MKKILITGSSGYWECFMGVSKKIILLKDLINIIPDI